MRGANQNLVQKILQRHLVEGSTTGAAVRSGDYVSVRPWRTMTHDNSHAVIQKFKALGAEAIHDQNQIVFTLDHDIQNKSEANLSRSFCIALALRPCFLIICCELPFHCLLTCRLLLPFCLLSCITQLLGGPPP